MPMQQKLKKKKLLKSCSLHYNMADEEQNDKRNRSCDHITFCWILYLQNPDSNGRDSDLSQCVTLGHCSALVDNFFRVSMYSVRVGLPTSILLLRKCISSIKP